MYLDYFGLSESPFQLTPDSKYLFLTKQYEAALSTIRYIVDQRLGFVILTGEVGTGKTTTTRALLNQLPETVRTALLLQPILDVPELLHMIAKDFGIVVRNRTTQRVIEALHRHFLKWHGEGKTALLVIDEAQHLKQEALEIIRLLTNLETEKAKLLQILLVGQPELRQTLTRHDLRQLSQRIAARCHLAPLSFIETMRYITHRLCVAGGGSRVFFDPQAYRLIYRASGGIPRLINLLCDRSLLAAYVNDTPHIDTGLVKRAIRDWRGSEGKESLWQGPFHWLQQRVRRFRVAHP